MACTIPYVLLNDPLCIHHWWQRIRAPPPTPSQLAPIQLPRLPTKSVADSTTTTLSFAKNRFHHNQRYFHCISCLLLSRLFAVNRYHCQLPTWANMPIPLSQLPPYLVPPLQATLLSPTLLQPLPPYLVPTLPATLLSKLSAALPL